jgi:hypothetical protein
MEPLDQLLRSFVAQGRMKLTGTEYTPCYRLSGMSEPQRIRYSLRSAGWLAKDAGFQFRRQGFPAPNPAPAEPPFWTELEFSNARIARSARPSMRIVRRPCRWRAVEPLKALVSFDTVGVTVTQAERHHLRANQAQQALSSVLGLIMATAGCPWTDRLRPMARFHLPFASEPETVYRSICMYLLARELDGDGGAPGFAALEALYENLHLVNRDMSRRLGAATRSDPARNAMALLDAYTTPFAGRAGQFARGAQAAFRCLEREGI